MITIDSTRRTFLGVLAGGLITGLVACSSSPATSGAAGPTTNPGASGSSEVVLGADQVAPLVSGIVNKAGKDLKPERLGEGLVPPTNKWFSGLVFGDTAQPVFPLPLTFGVDGKGFAFGLPTVTTTEKNIMGGYAPIIQVGTGSATTWQVTAYDELSVTLTGTAGGQVVGTVLIAEGSPFVTFTAAADASLTTNLPFAASGDAYSVQGGAAVYGLVTKAKVSGSTLNLAKGQTATWFAVPDGGSLEAMAPLAADPVKATSASYEVTDKTSTTLDYTTVGGGKTAFAAMPHQQGTLAGAGDPIGTYASAYGTLTVYAGNKLTWTDETLAARAGLDLSKLSSAEKSEVAEAVKADVAAAKPYPADTYFGGKALYRDAQLMQIARQVGADDVADKLKQQVTAELEKWTDPKGCETRDAFCFFYDTTNHGIVGQTPSFGSDEFNDHHFHYGYFLYAAGVLAADDPDLAEKLAPVMNLLAADIATSSTNEYFVSRRNFDSYASHSWASGTVPFADGNNQESASEAVTAYAGLTLWAQASGNKALEVEARWMHALEGASAQAYWTNFNLSDPVYSGFTHKVMPLNWGGKRDYATWFSAEPAAALAILLIPVSPSSDQLKGDAARIAENVAEGVGTKGFNQQYGDYILMYSALAGEDARVKALDELRKFDKSKIDDGNTYSYTLAWLLSLKP
ncbi:glycosyl hydrolase [Micropruina glycogenica]|uniref:glucan endo-1,3-beta-D-glucosidase n=1 Tax=Micropruina glycogenica TaxID=75385 RepID=A0A2N9JFN7_9ACTN|nr:glycosyl hydrolase [Micropruina glycogenica]SPD86308.1 Endoglucanase Acf2 [Micropruina glycogenica]